MNWYCNSVGDWYELDGGGGLNPWHESDDNPTAPPGWNPPPKTDAEDPPPSRP